METPPHTCPSCECAKFIKRIYESTLIYVFNIDSGFESHNLIVEDAEDGIYCANCEKEIDVSETEERKRIVLYCNEELENEN